MGFVQKRGGDESGSGGSGLELDLDLRACSICRRELLPWQDTCPDDGGEAVLKTQLEADDPVAARLAALLDDGDPDEGDAGDAPGDAS